jgi:hypothetical protein
MRTFRLTIRQPDDSLRHERIRAESRQVAWDRCELCLRRGELIVNCCEV